MVGILPEPRNPLTAKTFFLTRQVSSGDFFVSFVFLRFIANWRIITRGVRREKNHEKQAGCLPRSAEANMIFFMLRIHIVEKKSSRTCDNEG